MFSTYSFGEDSPIKFQISDKLATYYNQAVEQFFKAQTRFNQKFGRKWDPHTDPIEIRWNKKQKKAWNEFAKVFDQTLRDKGPFHENDIMDDFLVKNIVGAAAASGGQWDRAIGIAVMGGALHGFFSKR